MIVTTRNARSSKSLVWTFVLIVLGVAAIYAGEKWLVLLIPAAVLVWYGAKPVHGSSRN